MRPWDLVSRVGMVDRLSDGRVILGAGLGALREGWTASEWSGEFTQAEGAPHDWEQAGATWWVESWWSVPRGPDGLAEVRRRVAAGPPAA